MRDYYEELWRRLPEGLDPPDFERRRRFLLNEVQPGQRVLDLGFGAGDFTAVLAKAGTEPVGVEIAQSAVQRARTLHPNLDFRNAPIDGPLPLEDNSFDVVWASEVIEHIADTARSLSEIRRVLVPRGRLLVTTPSHGRLRVAIAGIESFSEPLGDHLHLYTRRSLGETLGGFGFHEIHIASAGGPPGFRRMLLARATR